MVGKFTSIYLRIRYYFLSLPTRFLRLFIHLVWPFGLLKDRPQLRIIETFFDWLLAIPLYILDILAVPELYEILIELIKWNTRSLADNEKVILRKIFKEALDLDIVRLDECAYLGPKQYRFAYVGFQTINSFGRLSTAVLVHEMVHVWQYRIFGSVYILKALQAQSSKEGYNYGGRRKLRSAQENQLDLFHFNFEQQAEIIMDSYRAMKHQEMNNLTLGVDDFGYYLKQIQNG